MRKVTTFWSDLLRSLGSGSRHSRSSATIDLLTGLPTRLGMISEVRRALSKSRHRQPVGLVIIEFSSVIGDIGAGTPPDRDLIVQLGKLLRSWISSEHVIGHMRDREFAILVRGLSMRDVEHLADQVGDRVRTDPALQSRRGQIATIVGVGYSSKSECDASQLMGLADIAVHYATATGRSWHAIVDKSPGARAA